MVAQDTGEKITEGKVRKTSSTSTPAGSREREEKAERSVKGQKEKKLRRKNPKKKRGGKFPAGDITTSYS